MKGSKGSGALMQLVAYGPYDYLCGYPQNGSCVYGHTHGHRNPTSPSLEYSYISKDPSIKKMYIKKDGTVYNKKMIEKNAKNDYSNLNEFYVGYSDPTLVAMFNKEIKNKLGSQEALEEAKNLLLKNYTHIGPERNERNESFSYNHEKLFEEIKAENDAENEIILKKNPHASTKYHLGFDNPTIL